MAFRAGAARTPGPHKRSSLRSSQDRFRKGVVAKFELLLDGAPVGPVWLKNERVAARVAESLHYRHETVYRLDAFTIMSNHVHAVIKPLPINPATYAQDDTIFSHPLAAIMQSFKGYTALNANQIRGAQENSGRMRVTTIGSSTITSGSARWLTF